MWGRAYGLDGGIVMEIDIRGSGPLPCGSCGLLLPSWAASSVQRGNAFRAAVSTDLCHFVMKFRRLAPDASIPETHR